MSVITGKQLQEEYPAIFEYFKKIGLLTPAQWEDIKNLKGHWDAPKGDASKTVKWNGELIEYWVAVVAYLAYINSGRDLKNSKFMCTRFNGDKGCQKPGCTFIHMCMWCGVKDTHGLYTKSKTGRMCTESHQFEEERQKYKENYGELHPRDEKLISLVKSVKKADRTHRKKVQQPPAKKGKQPLAKKGKQPPGGQFSHLASSDDDEDGTMGDDTAASSTAPALLQTGQHAPLLPEQKKKEETEEARKREEKMTKHQSQEIQQSSSAQRQQQLLSSRQPPAAEAEEAEEDSKNEEVVGGTGSTADQDAMSNGGTGSAATGTMIADLAVKAGELQEQESKFRHKMERRYSKSFPNHGDLVVFLKSHPDLKKKLDIYLSLRSERGAAVHYTLYGSKLLPPAGDDEAEMLTTWPEEVHLWEWHQSNGSAQEKQLMEKLAVVIYTKESKEKIWSKLDSLAINLYGIEILCKPQQGVIGILVGFSTLMDKELFEDTMHEFKGIIENWVHYKRKRKSGHIVEFKNFRKEEGLTTDWLKSAAESFGVVVNVVVLRRFPENDAIFLNGEIEFQDAKGVSNLMSGVADYPYKHNQKLRTIAWTRGKDFVRLEVREKVNPPSTSLSTPPEAASSSGQSRSSIDPQAAREVPTPVASTAPHSPSAPPGLAPLSQKRAQPVVEQLEPKVPRLSKEVLQAKVDIDNQNTGQSSSSINPQAARDVPTPVASTAPHSPSAPPGLAPLSQECAQLVVEQLEQKVPGLRKAVLQAKLDDEDQSKILEWI
ncbi:unnamed protein product, partial [Polarella glacialis]